MQVICDALGCFELATQNVKLTVGSKGEISLRVCNGCVFKFNEHIHKQKKGLKGVTGLGQASRKPAAHGKIRDEDPYNE